VAELAVTAIGRDRPGIVAAVSGVLYELRGNLEDSRMSILRGHFAVMLIVELPDDVAREELDRRLATVRDELGLEAITINEVDRLTAPSPRPTHVVSVYGADHPGIVHAVTSALAEREVNITDLETRVAGSAEAPVYVMLMEVELGDAAEEQVAEALRRAGEDARVEVSLRRLEAEAL
jgi:glycine cleavage system transcriptional repressor